MSKLLDQVFVTVILLLASESFASVDVPSDDSDLTKSILDENPTPGAHFYGDTEDDDQTSAKSNQNSEIYGQTQAEQLNDQLSLLDVLLRKRRAEASTKSAEKVFDIPHADKLPIKDDTEYVASNNDPTNQDDKLAKDSTNEKAYVRPITFKLASSTNQEDNNAKDKDSDDKTQGEAVKIIVQPLGQTS